MLENSKYFERWISLLSLIVAICALMISVRGCSQAEKSLELSQAEYASQRFAVFRGEFYKEGSGHDFLRISSVREDIILQDAFIHFPPQVLYPGHKLNIGPPDFHIYIFTLQPFLKDEILEIRGIPDENASYHGARLAPMVLEANYVAKNEAYNEIALYFIDYTYSVSMLEGEVEAEINFDGIQFVNRLDPETDIPTLLEMEWIKSFEE